MRVLQHLTNILEMSRKGQEASDFHEVSEALALGMALGWILNREVGPVGEKLCLG